jgi:hypothetical protein
MVLFAVFVFLLAYYYFILRKYNTLGFRLFSLFFFVGASVLYWWWGDWRALKEAERNGINTMAEVTQKRKEGSDWLVEVHFKNQAGNDITWTHKGGMSDEELAAIVVNQPTLIRYSPATDSFFLEKSFQRQNHDMIWLLLFPGLLFLLGCLSWLFLRKYRIHPHEGTIYEYMTDETGQIVLDDAKNESTKNLRKANLISKIIQLFTKN